MKDKVLVQAIRRLYPTLDMVYVRAIYDDVEELGEWDNRDIKTSYQKIFYGMVA